MRALIISVILYENWSQTNNNSHKHDDVSTYLKFRNARESEETKHKHTHTHTHRIQWMAFKFYRSHLPIQRTTFTPAQVFAFSKKTYAKYPLPYENAKVLVH